MEAGWREALKRVPFERCLALVCARLLFSLYRFASGLVSRSQGVFDELE